MNGVSDIIAPFNVDAANDDNHYGLRRRHHHAIIIIT